MFFIMQFSPFFC